MWRNASKRISELKRLADAFDLANLPSTACEVRGLALALKSEKNVKQLQPPLEKVYEAFKKEWMAVDSHHKNIYKAFRKVMRGVFFSNDPSIKRTVTSLRKHLERRRLTENAILAMVPAIRSATDEARFYLLCYVYLVALEGVYDQSIRALYILSGHVAGQKVSLSSAHSKKLDQLKEDLERLTSVDKNKTSAVFRGYNRHLRNAIAHAYLSYDSKSCKMRFEDFDPNSGRRTWRPLRLGFEQFFNDYYQCLENVSTFLGCLIWLVWARDLAIARGVP